MEIYSILYKGLAVGVILLFIGTAVLPTLAQSEMNPSLLMMYDRSSSGFCSEVIPQIHLEKRHLPMLTAAITLVRNPFYKTVLQRIRHSLVQQGSLDESDLGRISTSMGITNLSFHAGFMTARGEIGTAFVVPFTLVAMTMYSLKRFYVGPIVLGVWEVDWASSDHSWLGVSFFINGRETLSCKTSGIAIGGVGGYYRMVLEKSEFDFFGGFLLIIVNKNPP
jgi:hypothetical protein